MSPEEKFRAELMKTGGELLDRLHGWGHSDITPEIRKHDEVVLGAFIAAMIMDDEDDEQGT